MGAYETNGEWDVTDTSTEDGYLVIPENLPTTYPTVKFTITLARKPGYFVLNVIIPRLVYLWWSH